MMKIKRLFLGILAGTMMITAICPCTVSKVQAQEYWPSSVNVAAQSAIVMEEETGAILYEKNINQEHYPASITKIMTALVALENSSLDEIVTFSHNAAFGIDKGSSSISRDEGEQMTMEQCLYGLMLESANECAIAIGEHVAGGDINAFVQMMNDKAASLGCKNTHFSNSNGLPAEDHYTSVYDMALISRAAYANDKFAEIVGTRSYNIPPTNKHTEETLLNNHHAMLNYYQTNKYLYDYCLGGKTGYTTVANSTLVTYARKDGMTLVCVVMNVQSPGQYTDTRALFDYCFDNFSVYSVADHASLFDNNTQKDFGSLSDNIDLIKVSDAGVVILPKTANFADATATVTPIEDKQSDVIGRISYTYADRYVGGADLIYTSSETKSYPFHNIAKEEEEDSSYIRIDFKMILLVILLLLGIVGILYLIHLKSGNIILYKKRHIDSKKKPKSSYKQIQRNRRKRRKRR